MICTRCFSPRTRILETRTKRFEITRRQKCDECGNEASSFKTIEVPATVLYGFGRRAVNDAIDRFERGVSARSASRLLRYAIVDLLDAGTKPTAIAHELGCSEAYVRQVRKAKREAGTTKLEGR